MKVAVIGAGISGMTLAAGLRQRATGIDVAMYERDESRDSRPQGYAIGLFANVFIGMSARKKPAAITTSPEVPADAPTATRR